MQFYFKSRSQVHVLAPDLYDIKSETSDFSEQNLCKIWNISSSYIMYKTKKPLWA